MASVSILKTGLANLASVKAAFERLGVSTRLVEDPNEVTRAERLVVPGVGAYGPALDVLRERGLLSPLKARIDAGRATLGICLGLQLFGEGSEESPGVRGLGAVPIQVRAFGSDLISPQMGWNKVIPAEDAQLLEPGYAYFANSFRFEEIPAGWSGALADYGGPLVAALERGAVLGCQFHPELSGAYGEALISRWLKTEVPSC